MSPSAAKECFTGRPFFVLSLPLLATIEVLLVEQVVINIDRFHIDFGAFCFTKRCGKPRKPGRPRGVALGSLMADRRPQIRVAIEVLSSMISDGAMRPRSVDQHARFFKAFMDWADLNEHHACLSGGDATRAAFQGWAHHVQERLRRFEIIPRTAGLMQKLVCQFLESITGSVRLSRGIRLVSGASQSFGTEPATKHEFTMVVALSQALFDGLSELVLTNKPFPFKLVLPRSLGWEENYLWCFPANQWCLAPHLTDSADLRTSKYFGAYNYQHGRVSTVSEIITRYRRAVPSSAKRALSQGQAVLNAANSDFRHKMRLQLAVLAQAAFFFLFLANTGCNLAVSREIETDGKVSPSVENQSYRTIKFRAGGKRISVVIPIAFLPSLRRFMELRKFLLQDTPYSFLFFSMGNSGQRVPSGQINESVLARYFCALRKISPTIPVILSREIRATVEDYYRRTHDGFVSSRILGRSEASTDRSYLAGSPLHHQSEVSDFLVAVAQRAREQKIIKASGQLADAKRLEEGGQCSLPGKPVSLLPGRPAMADCRSGCIFCANRVLVANEEDARKVASAAFVMEQLIMGPQSEAEFRPQIQKCDEDLEKISSFDGCAPMVQRVRLDVFKNGNLTPYFADKYFMFLEIGIL